LPYYEQALNITEMIMVTVTLLCYLMGHPKNSSSFMLVTTCCFFRPFKI